MAPFLRDKTSIRRFETCDAPRGKLTRRISNAVCFATPLSSAGETRTDGRDSGDDLAKLELVQNGSFTRGIQANLREEEERKGIRKIECIFGNRVLCMRTGNGFHQACRGDSMSDPNAIRPIIKIKEFVLGVQIGEKSTECDQEEQEPEEGQAVEEQRRKEKPSEEEVRKHEKN